MVLKKKRKIPSGRELFASFRNAKREWNSKTALEQHYYLYGIGKAPAEVGQLNIFREDVTRPHMILYVYLGNIVIYTGLILYTFWYEIFYGEFQNALPCTCGICCLYAFVPLVLNMKNKNRFKTQSLIDFAGDYIYLDDHENPEYDRIRKKHLSATMESFIIKMTLLMVSVVACLLGPSYAQYTYGTRTTTTEIHIPFVEPGSDTEYIINSLFMQFFGVYGGLIAYVSHEVSMSMYSNTVQIMPDLIRCDINQLADEWEAKTITRLELTLRFKNIVKKSLDAHDFAKEVTDILYWRNLITPIMFTYGIAMCIYCQYTLGFVAGYGMSFASWVQLFFMCNLGDHIQDTGLNFYDAKWEVFPLNIQKTITFLIQHKQNEPGIQLGPFHKQIDRDSFGIITNKIYSFVMFLFNFSV